MHCLTGLAHDRASHVAYGPQTQPGRNPHRSLKLAALQKTLKTPPLFGDDEGDLLVMGWGSTKGAIEEAVECVRAEGHKVSALHLTFLQPMASGIKETLQRFKRVMTIENDWCDSLDDEIIDEHNRRYSTLAWLLRARYLVDADSWCEVKGQPMKPGNIARVIREKATLGKATTMTASIQERLSRPGRECPALADYTLEDYKGDAPRWCVGCGDNSILTAVQRLCRDEQLAPDKTVFVSGIGCSSRLPHYMNAYGFHGIHGRALPVAEGIKMTRPDLNVFVATGDGDCCSIGTAHWIHAIRYNIDMTVLMHDNQIYGLTKKQVSPTTPQGLRTSTTPRGAYLEPLNPLSVTLGVANVSFVAQAVDWIPELLYAIVSQAFHHKGFSFVRVLQRCPEFLPDLFEPFLKNPDQDAAARARGRRPDKFNPRPDLPDPGGT